MVVEVVVLVQARILSTPEAKTGSAAVVVAAGREVAPATADLADPRAAAHLEYSSLAALHPILATTRSFAVQVDRVARVVSVQPVRQVVRVVRVDSEPLSVQALVVAAEMAVRAVPDPVAVAEQAA